MARLAQLLLPSALFLALGSAGCAGPPIAAPIDGQPLCPDFSTGNAKMEGGLQFPVRLRVLDGKNVLYRTVLAGRRRTDDPTPKTFIVDDNAKYTVEWAQCGNQRAPHAASEAGADKPSPKGQGAKARQNAREGEGTAYECGEATIYKTAVLETKKGDRGSHVILFEPPPKPDCWAGDTVPASPAGGAPAPAPSATADAGAATEAVTDAGTAATSADAGASTGDAGAAKPK